MNFHTVIHKECIRVETTVGYMSHWSTEHSLLLKKILRISAHDNQRECNSGSTQMNLYKVVYTNILCLICFEQQLQLNNTQIDNTLPGAQLQMHVKDF